MRFAKITLFTILVLLGLVFIIENLEMLKQTVKIQYNLHLVYLESPEIPIWVIILFCFFLGVFTASLYGIYEIMVQRQTIRQLKHNLNILTEELKVCTSEVAPVRSREPETAPTSGPIP